MALRARSATPEDFAQAEAVERDHPQPTSDPNPPRPEGSFDVSLIALPNALLSELQKEADKRQTSVAGLIAQAIAAFIAPPPPSVPKSASALPVRKDGSVELAPGVSEPPRGRERYLRKPR